VKVVRNDTIVLKADERGVAFNDGLCADAASEEIEFHLKDRARQSEGLTRIYEGWIAPNESVIGYDSITWSSDSGAAKKAIVWNSPYHAFIRSPQKADVELTTVAIARASQGIQMAAE
jgi:hypothetical protein